MSIEGLSAERVRSYLRELPAGACAQLRAELERGLLRGDEIPGADLMLQELHAAMRRSGSQPLRIGNPARLFYQPLEPFLVDRLATELPGRIARTALTPIWEWICRDVAPEEARTYSDHASAILVAGNGVPTAELARNFQAHVTGIIGDLITGLQLSDPIKRRVVGQVGTPHALQDVQNLLVILRHQDSLRRLGARLPRHIGNLADQQLENVTALVHASTRAHPELLTFSLVLVADRLGARWQLLRVATKSAGSDVASRVMQGPFALAVKLVFAEMRQTLAELPVVLRDGRIGDCVALLKELHDAVRGMRTELDLGDGPWSRELAAIRTGVSDLLKAEIEAVPGRMRRLLRLRPFADVGPSSTLDSTDVAETEARIALLRACRNYASELAINQLASSTYSEIQRQLDSGNSALLDALRTAQGSEREYRQSQLDTAVRFSTPLLGADYAAAMTRAAASVTRAQKSSAVA